MATSSFEVLVVEDDLALREQTARLVATWGYRVRQVPDVPSALEQLAHAPADIILTDLLLANNANYELMRWSNARRVPTPVLVMTAYASLEYAIEALKQGAYDFLTKPITPPELEAALSRASVAVSLQRSRARAEHLQHIAEVALTLAHEINNPLAVIMGQLQLQLEEDGQPIDRNALEICLESAKRVADVVRKISVLHDVAYQEYGGFRLLDLEVRRPPAE